MRKKASWEKIRRQPKEAASQSLSENRKHPFLCCKGSQDGRARAAKNKTGFLRTKRHSVEPRYGSRNEKILEGLDTF